MKLLLLLITVCPVISYAEYLYQPPINNNVKVYDSIQRQEMLRENEQYNTSDTQSITLTKDYRIVQSDIVNSDFEDCKLSVAKNIPISNDPYVNAFAIATSLKLSVPVCMERKGYIAATDNQIKARVSYDNLLANLTSSINQSETYITINCKPKIDKEYIKCKKQYEQSILSNNNINELNWYYIQRNELDQQLIRKDITRIDYNTMDKQLWNDMIIQLIDNINIKVKQGISP